MKTSTTINDFQKLIIKFGGFDVKTAENTSTKTANILTQYSLLLLIPMTIGFAASTYTAYTISNNLFISLIVGAIWCFFIYFIDRAILSTNPSTSLNLSTTIRIIMSITLSTLFAEPIILLAFGDSIKEKQYTEFIQNKKPIDQKFGIKLNNINNQERESLQSIDHLQRLYTSEMDGTGGSGIRNQGPIFKQKYNDYLDAKSKHEKLEIKLEEERNLINDAYQTEVDNLKLVQANSFAGKLDSLHEINSPAIQFGVWILRLSLIFLELMPVLIKLKKSESWDSYWLIINTDNQEVNTVYSNNSEYRVEALNKDAQIKHVATMKMLDKEAVQVEMDHDFNVLEMQMDNVMKAHELMTEYKKEAAAKFAENPTLLNNILEEFDGTFGKFKFKTIKVES